MIPPPRPPQTFDPRHARVFAVGGFGAVADGQTLNTAALQATIDAAHAAGGGRVVLGAGVYLSGTLSLRSGVTLEVPRGATLLGSPRLADYRHGNWPALIKARGAERVAVIGEGTIDGQGALVAADTHRINAEGRYLDFFPGLRPGEPFQSLEGIGRFVAMDPHALHAAGQLGPRVFPVKPKDDPEWRAAEFVRPQLLEFWQCRLVHVSGLTLRNATCWVQTYRDCDDVELVRLKVESMAYWNNDGIDIVDSRRVTVRHCDVNSADDGICLKSDQVELGCEDVLVESCRVRTSASAIKFGTGSYGGFRRVCVRDIDIRDTFRSAVALEAVDGGSLEHVVVSRIRARNMGNAFFLRIGHRRPDRPPGRLRDVLLEDLDIEVTCEQPDAGYPHPGPLPPERTNLLPSSIAGLPGHPVENVEIRGLRLRHAGGGRVAVACVGVHELDRVPERAASYPEFSMFGELPAWGVFVRDAAAIRFVDGVLAAGAPDERVAVAAHRVAGLRLDGVTIAATPARATAIALRDVRNPAINAVDPIMGAAVRVEVVGPEPAGR